MAQRLVGDECPMSDALGREQTADATIAGGAGLAKCEAGQGCRHAGNDLEGTAFPALYTGGPANGRLVPLRARVA